MGRTLARDLRRRAGFARPLGAGDAEQLARRAVAEGYEQIVAAGGDGTINEVVNGIGRRRCRAWAAADGHDECFRETSWACRRKRSRALLGNHPSVAHPVGRLADRKRKHFVQLAGVGLDAQVVKETSLALKRNFGPLSYLISAAQIASRRPPRLLIEAEEAKTEEGSFVLVGNGRLYGGPFPFFKHAVIDDGLLDVLVFKQIGYLELLKYLQNVIFTSDITTREVEYFQTRRLRVSSVEEVPVELDGELLGQLPGWSSRWAAAPARAGAGPLNQASRASALSLSQ